MNCLRKCSLSKKAAILMVVSLAVTILIHFTPLRKHYLWAVVRFSGDSRRAAALNELSATLKIGMQQNEVQSLIGHPDNTDIKFVWMWELTRNRSGSTCWSEMLFTNGVFVVFDGDGALASQLLKNTESDPWEALDVKHEPGYARHLIGERNK